MAILLSKSNQKRASLLKYCKSVLYDDFTVIGK